MTTSNPAGHPAHGVPEPYPLLLQPEFHGRVWGGRRLAEVLHAQLPDGPVGESWSMGNDNHVVNGPLTGQTLGALIAGNPHGMLGSVVLASGRQDLPLLFKILDANDLLSIQVHPDDPYARNVEKVDFGKTEAWYVIDAQPGAYVIHGFSRPVTPDEVRAGLADGSIVNLLRKVPLQAGETFLVPAGTVHAIGGGLLLGEIQENSDTTYRLYDWGRPRELHIDKSLAVMQPGPPGFGPSKGLKVDVKGGAITYLCACRYFAYQLVAVQGGIELDTLGHSFHVLFCQAGEGVVRYSGGAVPVSAGQALFIPSAVRDYEIESTDARVLCSFVPDLRADIITPLQEAGYDAAQIGALGGPPNNELARLIDPACNA
jgi:mannose-6-phosphate isomerase